jgi:hypothetical protein
MKRYSLFIAVVLATLTSAPAYANLLDDLVGTWRVTTSYKEGGRTVSFQSQTVNKKLAGGVIYSVGTEKSNGKTVTTSKEWIIPGGNAVAVGYDNQGKAEFLGEGTWRTSGSTLSGGYAFETLRERVNWSGASKRINRNRWEQTVTIRQGSNVLTISNVLVRVR